MSKIPACDSADGQQNPAPFWSYNQDCCARCGMSALEMLQRGELKRHICEPTRVEEFKRNRAWAEWHWQSQEMI